MYFIINLSDFLAVSKFVLFSCLIFYVAARKRNKLPS